ERRAWVRLRGEFVPYPLQLNLHHMSNELRSMCMAGLDSAGDHAEEPVHLGEWIDRCFGKGIGDSFLKPYNLKVWGYPLEELSWTWTAERVARIDVACLRKTGAKSPDGDSSWGPNRRFRFPLRGGSGAVWCALARDLSSRDPSRFRMNRRLVKLD